MNIRINEAASILSNLSNAVRLSALVRLSEREWSVSELAVELNVSQSGISHHLAILRHSRLVKARRENQTVFYFCDDILVLKLLNDLELTCR